MPVFERGTTEIHYEVFGRGTPVLCIAPGGMRSSVSFWEKAALDPLTAYADGPFQLVAMDQRNTAGSRGPLDVDDPWGSYAADQLGLMDHLGIDRFEVIGCCIGGAYILRLIQAAPGRVAAAVLEQPIGVHAGNRELFEGMWRSWAEELVAGRDDIDAATAEAFGRAMWAGDFVVSVARDAVRSCPTPLLVMPGIDEFHPTETGREIAALAPAAELLEPWKDPEHLPAATAAVGRFLRDHAPRPA